MNRMFTAIALLLLSGCHEGSAAPQGYDYSCIGYAEPCAHAWTPMVIDFGESISQGWSGPARYDLYGTVDYRHDDWDNEDIRPEADPYFYGLEVQRGYNDGNSSQLLARMETALEDRTYAVILMNSVTHDITPINPVQHGPRVPLDVYSNNVEAAAQLAEQHATVAVVWVNTPPIPAGSLGPYVDASEVATYNAAADKIARAHGFYILTMPGDGHLPDNVHYTGPGYDALGKQVAACITLVLEGQASDACHR